MLMQLKPDFCEPDLESQSPRYREPSSVCMALVCKLLITSDHSWESELLWSHPSSCWCAVWRLERRTALLNLRLSQLLPSYWNGGRFLLKCTLTSPHHFSLCSYRNQEPWGSFCSFPWGIHTIYVFFCTEVCHQKLTAKECSDYTLISLFIVQYIFQCDSYSSTVK